MSLLIDIQVNNWKRMFWHCNFSIITSQQTTTRDFTCSVREFMSSTGIHMFPYVNSPDSVNKFGVSTHVYCEITSFSHDDTYH